MNMISKSELLYHYFDEAKSSNVHAQIRDRFVERIYKLQTSLDLHLRKKICHITVSRNLPFKMRIGLGPVACNNGKMF